MNSSINWIFLWRLPIQNHLKPSITEKRRNKAKYLTWNSIRRKFEKKTSMTNPVKSLGCIKCYSSSSPRPVKSPSNSMRYNCKKIRCWSSILLYYMLGLTFSSKLEWGSYIISIAKTPSKKIEALIYSMKFLSHEVALYRYKSTICPCMEYCYHV